MNGSDISQASSFSGYGKTILLVSSEEEKTGVFFFSGSFFLLFFGVDVIEDLVSFQCLRFQVIADANDVFDIDVDLPGQTKILKGVPL